MSQRKLPSHAAWQLWIVCTVTFCCFSNKIDLAVTDWTRDRRVSCSYSLVAALLPVRIYVYKIVLVIVYLDLKKISIYSCQAINLGNFKCYFFSKLFDLIYYRILTLNLTPQLSPNPNRKPLIKCAWMNIAQCSFSLCKIIFPWYCHSVSGQWYSHSVSFKYLCNQGDF